jgi:8-amino-7-oxononanoate synthase
VTRAFAAGLDRWGVGRGASRLVVGDTEAHRRLEARLAAFEGTEAALVFNGGYPRTWGSCKRWSAAGTWWSPTC